MIGAPLVILTLVCAAAEPSSGGLWLRVETPEVLDGNTPLTTDLVETALHRRVASAPVKIRTGDSPGSGDWRIELSAGPLRQIILRITSPEGALLSETRVPTRGRRAKDLAHTLALVIVETLTPVLPVLRQAPPEAPPTQPEPTVVVAAPLGPTPSPWSLSLTLGGLLGTTFAQPRLALGGELAFSAAWHLLELEAEVAGWRPIHAEGTGFSTDAQEDTLRLGVGARVQAGRFAFTASVGPEARLVVIWAAGDDLLVHHAQYVDFGAGARLCVGTAPGHLQLRLCATVATFFEYERIRVDGIQVVDVGHTAAGLGLQVGWGNR